MTQAGFVEVVPVLVRIWIVCVVYWVAVLCVIGNTEEKIGKLELAAVLNDGEGE